MPNEKPEVQPLPDWVTDTPDELGYQLAVNCEGSLDQFIELTRAEYIELKAHLARMRRYTTAANILRSELRDELKYFFARCLADDEGAATDAEKLFLRDVFAHWDATRNEERDEIEIASCFMRAIGERQDKVMLVDEDERDAVRKLLRERKKEKSK